MSNLGFGSAPVLARKHLRFRVYGLRMRGLSSRMSVHGFVSGPGIQALLVLLSVPCFRFRVLGSLGFEISSCGFRISDASQNAPGG
jgi:hypothetical protein